MTHRAAKLQRAVPRVRNCAMIPIHFQLTLVPTKSTGLADDGPDSKAWRRVMRRTLGLHAVFTIVECACGPIIISIGSVASMLPSLETLQLTCNLIGSVETPIGNA